MDEDFEAHLVVVVVECQKRDSQTDSTIIYIDVCIPFNSFNNPSGFHISCILHFISRMELLPHNFKSGGAELYICTSAEYLNLFRIHLYCQSFSALILVL